MGDNFFEANTFTVSPGEIIFRCDAHLNSGTITVE